MKKAFTMLGMLLPATAFAHGEAEIYYLLWWYSAILFLMVCFVLLGTSSAKRKLYSILALILFSTLAWACVANLNIGSRFDGIIVLTLGLMPVLGFALGFRFGHDKKNEG